MVLQQKWAEEQQEERRESQRVRYLTSQHSPTDSYDGQLWQDWMESSGSPEYAYEEEFEEKSSLRTSERKADSNADAAAGRNNNRKVGSVLGNGVLLERH